MTGKRKHICHAIAMSGIWFPVDINHYRCFRSIGHSCLWPMVAPPGSRNSWFSWERSFNLYSDYEGISAFSKLCIPGLLQVSCFQLQHVWSFMGFPKVFGCVWVRPENDGKAGSPSLSSLGHSSICIGSHILRIFQLSVALLLPGFSGSNCGEVTFPGQHKFRGNRMHWGSGCTLVPYCSAVHGKFCKRRLPGFEMFQARNVLGGCCRKCIGRLWYIHHGL